MACTAHSNTARFGEINFGIYNELDQKVGEILLQYYPGNYNYKIGEKVMRLRSIEIDEKYKKQGHGTRALETLFTKFRVLKNVIPQDSFICLERPTKEHLKKWYEKFGFIALKDFTDLSIMIVPVIGTQFPYYAKLKAAQQAQAAALAQKKEQDEKDKKDQANVKSSSGSASSASSSSSSTSLPLAKK